MEEKKKQLQHWLKQVLNQSFMSKDNQKEVFTFDDINSPFDQKKDYS